MTSADSAVPAQLVLDYYATQSPITDPGRYASLYQGLPSDAPALVRVLQGAVVHDVFAASYGVTVPGRDDHVGFRRRAEDIVAKIHELDDRPLRHRREPPKRAVGDCRTFAVLLCSLLRHQRIPARVLAGYSTYTHAGKYQNHWICEYWSAADRRWVRVDAQIDEVEKEAMGRIDFDTCDLPDGKFLTGGEAWQLTRSGRADPYDFGISFPEGKGWGWVGLKADLLRDLMALNKLELLPWDANSFMEDETWPPGEPTLDLLDHVAALCTAADARFAELRDLYRSNPDMHMPADWQP